MLKTSTTRIYLVFSLILFTYNLMFVSFFPALFCFLLNYLFSINCKECTLYTVNVFVFSFLFFYNIVVICLVTLQPVLF